ncbi:MAG: FapA family protein [Bacteroides sp.]|nr:FapA family protein [Bacteroides sp.]
MAEEYNEISLNGKVSVFVDEYFMWAKVLVTKAKNGGHDVTKEDIIKELGKSGVVKCIDEKIIDDYLGALPDNKSIVVAEAIPAKDGENGQVFYNYEPKNDFKPTIDEETGIVNFKELGRIRNIKKGALLATIKYQTEGSPGLDIRGAEIQPIPGKPPVYSIGPGTILSNDQTKIFAADDGNLRWDKDRFVVDTVVTIAGHVDASVGNIDFVGDVMIKGGIFEGYRVKGKRVTVKENVTNAVIEASQAIEIKSGAVYSQLNCEGDVVMSFAENCTIYCKGQLRSKSLVNCNVRSEGEVLVQGGKGIIVGGECISYENITASQVGSDSYTKTVINLGNTAVLLKSHHELTDNFKILTENYKKLKNLYEKLNQLRQVQELTAQQEQARKQAFLFIMNERNTLAEMTAKIDENERILAKSRQLQLIVKTKCFPGVSLKLYNSTYDNNIESPGVVFYLDSDNEIKFRAGGR